MAHATRDHQRSGVALIMALGVLSLLILIISAFVISMRVEHLAARNASNKIRSRHYMQFGLSIASEHIAGQLADELIPAGNWMPLEITSGPDDEPDDLILILRRASRDSWTKLKTNQDHDDPENDNLYCLASEGYEVPEYPTLFSKGFEEGILLSNNLRKAVYETTVGWQYIIPEDENTGHKILGGRFAYLLLDLSGQLDIHHLTSNQYYAALGEDNSEHDYAFFEDLDTQSPYLAPLELLANKGILDFADGHSADNDGISGHIDDLSAEDEFLDAAGVYSYDPDPNQILYQGFPGYRGMVLVTNKFDLNSISTNLIFDSAYNAPQQDYIREITNTLDSVYEQLSDNPPQDRETLQKVLLWNLLNYMDEDRIPQTDTEHAWLDSYGIEAVPLINEFVLSATNSATSTSDDNGTNNLSIAYNFHTELWYPFGKPPANNIKLIFEIVPQIVSNDNFIVSHENGGQSAGPGSGNNTDGADQVLADSNGSEENSENDSPSHIVTILPTVMPPQPNRPEWIEVPEARTQIVSEEVDIDALDHLYKPFTNVVGKVAFPVEIEVFDSEGNPPELRTEYLPIGSAEYETYTRSSEPIVGSDPPTYIITTNLNEVVCTLSFYARVKVDGEWVDEAPGPDNPDFGSLSSDGPWYSTVTNEFAASVRDPRFNGRLKYWEYYEVEANTLGTTNENTIGEIGKKHFQGLPLLHRDGALETVGEIGYLATDRQWESLDLFDRPAAALLDLWTVNTATPTNGTNWVQGRIHALTPHPAAMRAMFADTLFGTNRLSETSRHVSDVAASEPELLERLANGLLEARENMSEKGIGQADVYVSELGGTATNALLPFATWLPLLEDSLHDQFDLTDLSNLFDDFSPGWDVPGRDQLEDLIRDLPDRITWRQNIILIFVRGQALAPDGRVMGDSLSAALMVRDSYTGLWAYKWIVPLY